MQLSARTQPSNPQKTGFCLPYCSDCHMKACETAGSGKHHRTVKGRKSCLDINAVATVMTYIRAEGNSSHVLVCQPQWSRGAPLAPRRALCCRQVSSTRCRPRRAEVSTKCRPSLQRPEGPVSGDGELLKRWQEVWGPCWPEVPPRGCPPAPATPPHRNMSQDV